MLFGTSRSGGMATLAASNVAGILQGFPVLPQGSDVIPFVEVCPHDSTRDC